MFCRYSQKGEEMQTAAPQSRGPTHAFLPQHPSKTSPSTITKVLSLPTHLYRLSVSETYFSSVEGKG